MGKTVLIHPTYFPNIAHFIVMQEADEIVFEVKDFFEKQTYRNRAYIHGAHGKQLLTVPVRHAKSLSKKTTDQAEIVNDRNWLRHHWKSIETAYRTSPYFEFYEDDLLPFFNKKYEKLVDLNIQSISLIFNLLGWEKKVRFTEEYIKSPSGMLDFRYLVDAKKDHDYIKKLEPYTQVFSDRNGFIPDLSFLDLLFMEGPASIEYLKKHKNLIVP